MAHERGKYTSRTKARKRAAEVLFEADQKGVVKSPPDLLRLLEERRSMTTAPSPLPAYAVRMVEGVASARPEIDKLLARHTKDTPLDRLPAFDLAVLRGAVWEMLHNRDEVPPIVAIDEAVAVVKPISTEDSPALVNAVLDAIRKEIENSKAPSDTSGTTDQVSDRSVDASTAAEEDLDEDLLNEY